MRPLQPGDVVTLYEGFHSKSWPCFNDPWARGDLTDVNPDSVFLAPRARQVLVLAALIAGQGSSWLMVASRGSVFGWFHARHDDFSRLA